MCVCVCVIPAVIVECSFKCGLTLNWPKNLNSPHMDVVNSIYTQYLNTYACACVFVGDLPSSLGPPWSSLRPLGCSLLSVLQPALPAYKQNTQTHKHRQEHMTYYSEQTHKLIRLICPPDSSNRTPFLWWADSSKTAALVYLPHIKGKTTSAWLALLWFCLSCLSLQLCSCWVFLLLSFLKILAKIKKLVPEKPYGVQT